jgi:pimeloyl-ACP methyl ester carboxylesterase
MTQTIDAQDHRIRLAQGHVFSRSWTPPTPLPAAPIVLLHDSLGCVELWRDFPGQLAMATGRRVVAYDRLGFGRSDARTGRPGLDFVAQEAHEGFAAVREQLGLEQFVAMGHSVGGGMAIHCAAQAGSDCEALVTIAAQAFTEERTLEGIRAAREQFQDPAQVQRLARYHGERAPWVLDAWIGCWLDPAFAHWTLVDVLPGVRCRTLALHGDRDEYGSTRHPTLIGERCGGPTQVEVLPDTGHVPHRERTGQVLGLIEAFLRPRPGATAT